jgi:hypothetical protein
MTARHVVKDLLQETAALDPQTGAMIVRDGAKPQSSDRLACLFDYWAPIAAFDIKAPPRDIETVPAADACRGWHRLNGPAHIPQKGAALAILQHPAGGPQMFGKGDYADSDPSPARIFYTTNTNGGSSGSPCFDSGPNIIAFRNGGYPTAFRGPTEKCNQGVLINPILDALRADRPELLQKSQRPFKEDDALWSLSDDPDRPEPILGRADFKEAL